MFSVKQNSIVNLQDILDSLPKDPVDFTFTDDLLALSCCLYRVTNSGQSHGISHLSLQDESGELAKLVCDLDRAKAEKIRKYYKDKLLVHKLKGQKLSKFRQELLDFLYREDRYTYPYNYIGMAYRLPYFYDYDTSLVEIFGGNYFDLKGPRHLKGEYKLTFIKKLSKQTKHVNNVEFWFSKENDDRVMISIQAENPLLPLFERYIQNDDTKLSMILYARKNDSLNYYSTQAYNFL